MNWSDWWTISNVTAIASNSSEALALFALAGLCSGLARYRRAARKDLLFATLVFLLGTVIVQVPVYLAWKIGWSLSLSYLAATGRVVQIIGAVLFVRGSLRDNCPDWAWKAVVLFIFALTLVI